MASKRHPLDVFRSTDEGFTSASRERRRKITGKVLASSAREAAPPGRAAKHKKASKPKAGGLASGLSMPRLSPAAFELLRKGGFGLAALALVVVAVLSIHTLVSEGSDAPPILSKTEVLGPGRSEPLASPLYTIRASQYPGTPQAEAIAWEARTRLLERGFLDVLVLRWPDPEQPERVARYELVVGAADSAEDLAGALAALQAITDWPGGRPAPFTTARVVTHPMPEAASPRR